jgi:hypothetical protein
MQSAAVSAPAAHFEKLSNNKWIHYNRNNFQINGTRCGAFQFFISIQNDSN